MACGNARVENSELDFVKSSSEVVSHVASDVIFEEGGGEAVTMNGGVGRGVVNKGHVFGFIQGISVVLNDRRGNKWHRGFACRVLSLISHL